MNSIHQSGEVHLHKSAAIAISDHIGDMARTYRIGQIVPSSNTTIESEISAMLRSREAVLPERFTFHSSRMRMGISSVEDLSATDGDSDRCALELSDANVDVMGNACLVATMNMGKGYHRVFEDRLHQRTLSNGHPAPVVTSAGALVDGIKAIGARKVSIIASYVKTLTKLVIEYIEHEGIEVVDSLSLEIADHLAVGRLDPLAPADLWRKLNLANVDAIVASACVRMPSLASIPRIEAASGLPVLSSSVGTAFQMLTKLGLVPIAPHAGRLLSGHIEMLS